ncbi:DUF4352 domain-containing protein [Streptomyces sp. PKU-EA00015]|uniref:DUF4352 domain-containing protein n=1 Tax=Streptomyces sp. PKU-EA00015 TaxID=2748326 RepID=UPI0015A01585|nr:DUF4352 domain-containing protein [Streptomyces sp. PKU-EA00015]NWF27330.1 DUF4352 domain-containing protein [Streptomyces sp. PKU-EA00015]
MTHPNPPRSPYGQQPRHGHGAQPGYGYPAPQQPHPGPYAGGPAPYQTPPPPKKRMSTWAVAGIAFGGVFAFLILVGAIAGSGDDTTQADGKAAPKSSAPAEPAQEKKDDTPAESEPAPQSPVKIAAKKTAFAPSILHDGGAYTSVQVTITNNSDKKISVNPLYFSLTDTGGSKHTAELGVDENQMDTTDLAPGENMTGVITGKGGFTPKYVTYTDGLLGDTVRGDVS